MDRSGRDALCAPDSDCLKETEIILGVFRGFEVLAILLPDSPNTGEHRKRFNWRVRRTE